MEIEPRSMCSSSPLPLSVFDGRYLAVAGVLYPALEWSACTHPLPCACTLLPHTTLTVPLLQSHLLPAAVLITRRKITLVYRAIPNCYEWECHLGSTSSHISMIYSSPSPPLLPRA